MKREIKWKRIIYIIGVVALFIGAIDPLEGSIIIAAACSLILGSTYLTKDSYWKMFLAAELMIVFGVFFLFYLSSLGGFGGTSALSWWWGLLILPYPIGWLMAIIVIIVKAVKKKKIS